MSAVPGTRSARLGWIVPPAGLLLAAVLTVLLFDDYGRALASAPVQALTLVSAGAVLFLVASLWPGVLFAVAPMSLVLSTSRGFFPFELVVLGLAAYAVLDALARRDGLLYGPPAVHAGFLAFMACCALSLFVVPEPLAYASAMKRLVVGYCGLAVVLRYADRRLWKWSALSVPLAGSAIAVRLFQNYLARGFHVRSAFLMRAFYSDLGWGVTNYVGAVLSLAILGSFILLVLSREPLVRAACAVGLALMGVAMALLVSRGTIVAVGVGVLALTVLMRGRRRWLVLALAGGGVALLSQVPVFHVIVARFTTTSQMVSYVDRVRLWLDALDRFLAHPLLGVGLGQGGAQADALGGWDPHNYFLSVASETGVVGLAGWLFLLAALVRSAWRAGRLDPARAPMAHALLVFVAVAALHSCYEPTFPGTHYLFLFFWVFAVLYRAAAPGPPEMSPAGAPASG